MNSQYFFHLGIGTVSSWCTGRGKGNRGERKVLVSSQHPGHRLSPGQAAGIQQRQALEEGWAAPRQGQQCRSTPKHCTPDATETNRRAATAKREALERRMKTPRAPFANIYFSRVSLRKWRATKAQVPDQSRTLPNLLKHAHVALWEGFESSRDGNHMLAYPPWKKPNVQASGQTTN